MNSSKRLFGKPYLTSLVCKSAETFHEKMLPFCFIVILCFCYVMKDLGHLFVFYFQVALTSYDTEWFCRS